MKTSKMCKVSGGGLPDGFEAKVDVELDYTGVSEVDILNRAVSHDIIGVQRILRAMTTSELNELAKTGYKFNAALVGTRKTVDVNKAYKTKFCGMTRDEQLAQIAELENELKDEDSLTSDPHDEDENEDE